MPDFHYGEAVPSTFHAWTDRGLLTERGLGHVLECVAAMKEALGDGVGLALDCGPGWTLPDAIRFARAVEKHNLMWLEDMLTGDYIPYVNADVYAEVTRATSTRRWFAKAKKDHEWEDFSREMLARGGDLRRYYPLSDAARAEYEAWKAHRGRDPSR